MSVIYSGTMQGRFTSDGTTKTLMLRPDVDWIRVYNLTNTYADATAGAEFYWQRGMTQGRGTVYSKTVTTGVTTVAQIAANSGFLLVDSSLNVPQAAVAYTAVSNGTPPVVSTGNTAGLVAGQTIVRMVTPSGSDVRELGGLDFTVGTLVSNTSFQLKYMAQVAAGTFDGTFRVIPYDPIFYPRSRYISAITQAAQAVVTMTVTHGYQVGQVIRFIVPDAYGMKEINGLQGTILAINTTTNTITVNIDTTAFTAFVFPLDAAYPFSPAQVIPVGANTAVAIANNQNVISDSIVNTAYLGIQLMGGASLPGGAANDVVYWVAGKSSNVDNQLVTNP